MDLNNEACLVNSPPMADYPRYASGDLIIQAYSDMHHFDIKVPSEHTINGTMFDAEIQMFHTSLVMPRMSSLGIVIRADPDAYDNPDYQIILNEFGMVYNLHALECAQKRLRERRNLRLSSLRRGATGGMNTIVEEEEEEAYLASEIKKITDRQLQFRSDNFDPYSENIMTTMFFYRYDGSITEPPCRDITWWIMKDPMVISTRQLFETKRLLFSHVDSDCTATSVHNSDQSVARPLFGLGEDRDIQYCRDGDFRSDADKGRPPGNECRP
jgi:carbonic anhydrase